jgi:hypothetical protein
MYVPMQQRRDIAANWTSGNPVLLSGEIGLETDTSRFKIGDGATAWASLSYFSSGGGNVSSVFSRTGVVVATSGDYTVSQVTGAAPSASPTFTGTPSTPTATALTNNTQIASTAYADSAVTAEKNRAQTAEGLALQKASNLSDLGTRQTAMNNIAGAVTANQFLRGNGSNVVMAAIVAADLPAATTSTQGATIIDGTATDIVASPGTQAAGAVGKVADAGHVHPQPSFFAPTGITGATTATRYAGGTLTGPPLTGTFSVGDWVQAQDGPAWVCVTAGTPGVWRKVGDQPWQFRPESYGAKGNGTLLSDAAITSGFAVLTSPGNRLSTATTGMSVRVIGAGSAGADLVTTILSVQSAGQVTLAANAGGTVSGKGCVFGSDDTAAINSAVTAATAYAQANNGYGEVVFRAVTYVISGSPVTGSPTFGNAQIPLPVIAVTAQKVTLAFRGSLDQTGLNHWLQTVPQAAGTVLLGMRDGGVNDSTNGPTCVIGGPYNGYGGGGGLFSNMLVVIDGIEIMVPLNGTYGGFDFFGVAEASVPNAACMAMAVVPAGTAWPAMGGTPSFSNFGWFGLRMPSTNNNAVADIGRFRAEGMVNGLRTSEHTTWQSVHAINCYTGIVPYSGTTGNMPHASIGQYACVENCINAVASLGSPDGNPKVIIELLDVEQINNVVVNDAGNNLHGYIGYSAFGSPTVQNGATNLTITNRCP